MNVMVEYGEDLKARRLALGLSRQEAYKKFRVPLPFIDAIEEGRPDDLPQPIYTRGFIKTYCEALGASPEAVTHAYEEALHRPVKGFSFRSVTRRADRPKWLDDTLMWAAIAGVVITVWIAYSLIVRPGAPRESAHVQAETVELPISDPFSAP